MVVWVNLPFIFFNFWYVSVCVRYTMGSETKYEKSPRELTAILATMVADERLDLSGGVYRLAKK